MTDRVYQSIQYPLRKVVRLLTDLEDINSLPPEQLAPENRSEVKKEIKEFLEYWENGGRDAIKELIQGLRENSG